MTSDLEYHFCVRRSIPASVAVFGLSTLLGFFVASGHAQVSGAVAPPTAGGGHFITSTVPSVTGPVRPSTGTVPNVNSLVPTRVAPSSSAGTHHHRHNAAYGPVWYAVPVPYPVDGSGSNYASDSPDDNDSDSYQGGPTVFDRRGDGADSYVPPVDDVASAHSVRRGEDTSEGRSDDPPADPPQLTLLVFKDGHKLEVTNYAIIGAMLFDMTPGHARKVPVADLDLEATQQRNEERGVTFQLPMSSQAN